MSRPEKIGLDYFNIDTDFFADRKIKRLIHKYKSDSISLYLCLLCDIYNDKGYYIELDEDLIFDLQDRLKIDENLIKNIIVYCIDLGLFNKELYNKYSILTSLSIQERFSKIVYNLRRLTKIAEKYNILVTSEETPITSEETPKKTTFSTQKKRKEIKGKEIKDSLSSKSELSLAQTDRILEIFLFKKMINPIQEIQTFIDHYARTGWIDKNGNKIKDLFAAARSWDQNKPGTGYKLPENISKQWQSTWKMFHQQIQNFEISRIFLHLEPINIVENILKIRINPEIDVKLFEETYRSEYNTAIKANFKIKGVEYSIHKN